MDTRAFLAMVTAATACRITVANTDPTPHASDTIEAGATPVGFMWAVPADNLGCWFANTENYPACSGYESLGYTCVGNHCAQMDPDYQYLSLCATKAAAGTVVDSHTGKCVPGKRGVIFEGPSANASGAVRHPESGMCLDASVATQNGRPPNLAPCDNSSGQKFMFEEPNGNLVHVQKPKGQCWFANTDNYPACSNYESAGYTCVGVHCAAIDPVGDPVACAAKAPPGTVVDASTGTCVPPHGTHGQRMCVLVEGSTGPGVVMWTCPGPDDQGNTEFVFSNGTLCSKPGSRCLAGDCKSRCFTVKNAKPACQKTTPGCHPPKPPPPPPGSRPCTGMCWNFTYKCRVASVEAAPWESQEERARPRSVPHNFTWSWGKVPVKSSGTGWTPVTPFLGHVDGAKWKRVYPNTGGLWFAQHWSVEHITVSSTPPRPPGDTSLWNVECQLGGGDFMDTKSGTRVRLSGDFVPITGRIWGSRLGVLVINDIPLRKNASVTTMLRYNQHHYGPNFASVPPVTHKPKKFPITDCYAGGDTDYDNAQWGLAQMDRIGFHGLCYSGDRPNRHTFEILKALGQDLTIGALSHGTPFAEPGTGHTYNSSIMDAWAEQVAAPYKAAGWKMTQMSNLAIADEPGWRFPADSPEKYMNTSTSIDAGRMKAEWLTYLKKQRPPLSPADFGESSWDTVVPSPQRWDWAGNKTLPLTKKRLFYWSVRFSVYSSAVAFSRATQAMERAFFPGVQVFSNFNNFHGRAYVPSGGAGDGAGLGEDMFEFGRNRATTLLWTEDWFSDGMSGQWSYYMARFRSAARLAPAKDVEIGGYIVGRTSSHRKIKMKALAQIAGGAKSLRYYTFGPEYNFPGNSYSDVTSPAGRMLTGMANAHEMIAKAEDILWPARRSIAEVGILFPQSATYWDLLGVAAGGRIIEDFTNHYLDDRTTDYLAEVWGLWRAMALFKNIPVDFVDEAGLLEPNTLKPFKVLFITEPDLPTAGAAALGRWVRAGGTLITVSNAGTSDQYHEPSSVLAKLSGMASKRDAPAKGGLYQGERFYWPSGFVPPLVKNGTLDQSLCPNATLCKFGARGAAGDFIAVEDAGPLLSPQTPLSPPGGVLGTFSNGKPAIKKTVSGKGAYIHFAWLPGISFSCGGGTYQPSQSNAIASLLQNMLQLAGVRPLVSVSVDNVEAPILTGPRGDVVIALYHASLGNITWDANGTMHGNLPLELNVTLGYKPSSVTSMQLGTVPYTMLMPGEVSTKLPVFHFADVIVFKR